MNVGMPSVAANDGQDIASSAKQRFEIGEELIVTMYAEDIRLGDILAINESSGLMVNLDELIGVLDFPINKLRPFYYQGWFIKEAFTFELKNEEEGLLAYIKGQQQRISPLDFKVEYGELYISMALIDKWFNTNSRTDYENLKVVLRPKEPFPVQLAKQRKNKTVFSNIGQSNRSVRPFLNRGYEIFSPQTFDLQTSIRSFGENTTSNYSLLGAREIAYHNVNLFVTGTDVDPLAIGRLNVRKESYKSDLLGWANASRYEFGDISPVRVGNLDSRGQSVGFSFSNGLLNNNENTEVTNFSGEIQQNWDVELYRNGILLAQEFDVQTGRYEFLNIPLIIGNNVFEIVLYGPQGQVKKTTIERLLDSRSLREQPLTYNLSLTKDDEVLIRNATQTGSEQDTYSLSGNYNFSTFGNTSVSFGHVNRFGDDSSSLYSLQLGNIWADKYITNVSYSLDSDNSNVLSASLRANFGKQSFSLSGSQVNRNGQSTDVNVLLSATGPLFNNDFGQLSHQTEIETRRVDGQNAVFFRNNLGFSVRAANFYNRLEYIDVGTEDSSLSGSFSMQANVLDVFSRLFFNYSDYQEKTITNIGAQFSYPFTDKITGQLSVSESLVTENSSSRLELDYRGSWWNVSANVAYSSVVGESFGIVGRLNFGGTPELGSYISSSRNLSSTGTVVVRAFLDANGNYSYDEDEELLEGLKFKSKQSVAVDETDESGKSRLLNLAAQRKTDIEVDIASIDDPFIIPALEGISVVPRAGFVDLIDFPMLYSGEVDGVVRIINSSGNAEVAAYVDMGLFDKNNQLINEASTEYDGYFLMTKIPPGSYTLRPTTEEIQKLGLTNIEPIKIEVETSGSFIDGLELTYEQKRRLTYYIATVGEFSNDSILYAFWRLNKKAIRSVTGSGHPVANLEKTNGKKSLAVASSLDEFALIRVCADLKALSLDCDIQAQQEWRY